ncbi:TPA: ead/Ea22-like family protein, partial [Klebsiella pneumoniae]|nr:ead/Ea22-like family protein [Klebsiella pneumoniae]
MTDITELAQSLKAAAEKAKHAGETPVMPFDARISALNEYQITACPDNILALVAALEKAQRANAAQDDHINQQQDRIDQLEKGHQEAAKQINSWRRMAKQNIAEREKDIAELDAARQRIAELESRTVKLPDLRQIVSGDRYVWSDGVYNYSQDVKVVL